MNNPNCIHNRTYPNLCPCDYFEPVSDAAETESWENTEKESTEKKS